MWDYFSWHEMEGNVQVCDREKRAEMKEQADSEHDELTIDIGGISGWKEMTIQVKDFPTSHGVPIIKHLMVYTKNN